MSTLKFYVKVTRPIQVIFGGLAAWVVALLSNGPDWFGEQKVAAGLVIAFSVLGASVWHFGARADVYARKHWDLVIVRRPFLLMAVGATNFMISIIIAWRFLPTSCLLIAIANAAVIICYAKIIDQYWPWKNLSIAAVCVTPLLVGWFSGHRLSPIVPWLILAAFFFYLSREIFKDILDIEANKGKRFTMVMAIGTPVALRIGGVMLAISVFIMCYSLKYAPPSIIVWLSSISGAVWLSWFVIMPLKGENVTSKFRWMDVGVFSILISLLGTRMSMY